MSSPAIPVRRRRRSEPDISEEDSDFDTNGQLRSSESESSSHARIRGTQRPSQFGAPDSEPQAGHQNRAPISNSGGDRDVDDLASDFGAGHDEYQAGAIVRVKVTNFVTYEEAVFTPGPNLNMVIGPNGTGKSSLVCAICLGLGYGPSNLGRAQKVGEFVKHGKDDATIEVELQRRYSDAQNHIVKVRITRDGDKRKWWINDSETSLKTVQALTRELGIQVDNLCQFLPQDRVAEFAGLNPVELLHHTQRAAAPPEMLAWHEQLKLLRKEQKALQLQHESDQEALANQEERQENLRADVERLQERAQIQDKIAMLEKTVPFIEYASTRKQHYAHKQRKQEAQKRLKELERQVEPTLRAVNAKQEYRDQIEVVVKERKKIVEEAERNADIASGKIEEVDAAITELDQRRKAEIEGDKKRKQDVGRIQNKIRDLEASKRRTPTVFNSEEWNMKIRAKEQRTRQIESEMRPINERMSELKQQGIIKRRQIEEAQSDLQDLDSQAGRQVNKLRHISKDTTEAWDWIQKNMDQFEKPVHGPAMIECSIKDPRYTSLMEALFQRSDLISITAQTRADFKKLSMQLYDTMELADINLKCQTRSLAEEMQRRQHLSQQQMEQLGLDCWAADLLEGPDPLLAMLCGASNLHSVGIALQDVSEAQFNMLANSRISAWASGRNTYRTSRRAEYGAAATSTVARNVKPAQLWTDQPVDVSARRVIEEKIQSFNEEFQSMKVEVEGLRQNMDTLRNEKVALSPAIADLRKEKNEIQTAAGHYAALPKKIEREQEVLRQKEEEGRNVRQRLHELVTDQDELTLKKSILALEHKEKVERLRACHEAYLEAEIRLAEAASDVQALTERNAGIAQGLEDERRLVAEVEREAKKVRDAAAKALEVCKVILAEEEAGPNAEYFRTVDPDQTLEDLEHEIEAERSKLEFIHGGNAGALREFESRQVIIEKLEVKLEEASRKLEKLNRKITDVRQKWEPELDKLIKEISDAFAHNFEQIGCAGEVGVHKDDDFDLWAIEIKVRFRENESLQLLDQHRQSGGERSVSTIFYLMSLQSLARAPFRVVDEINQGMDPRNERMVHERMVEIACKEHTSQYFLITPKLLTGLKYDPRMKVLCIASGEYMPEDHSMLDIRRAIQMKGRAIAATG